MGILRLTLCATVWILLAGSQTVAGAASEAPVVVELFTSQGCSSCPPADRLLANLGAASGGEIVPLAFHIDSWNYLGWTDPFSQAAWTRRQVAYARALSADPYTPQAVIAGCVEILGSDEAAMRSAIAAAAIEPAARISLTAVPVANEIRVTVDVNLPESLRDREPSACARLPEGNTRRSRVLELMLAVFENGLVTPVERGENGGHTLRNDYVVRRLERIGRLRPGDPAHTQHSASVKLGEDWTPSRLGVAVLVQNPKSLEILGAAVQAPQVEEGE
jgi:hypothetical protein